MLKLTASCTTANSDGNSRQLDPMLSRTKDLAYLAGPLPPPLQCNKHSLSSIPLSLTCLNNNWFPDQALIEKMVAAVDGTTTHGNTLLSRHSTQLLITHSRQTISDLPRHVSMLPAQVRSTFKPRPTLLSAQVKS